MDLDVLSFLFTNEFFFIGPKKKRKNRLNLILTCKGTVKVHVRLSCMGVREGHFRISMRDVAMSHCFEEIFKTL